MAGSAYELKSDGTVTVHVRTMMWDSHQLPLGTYFPSVISEGNWCKVIGVNGAGMIVKEHEVPKEILMAHLLGM